MVFAVEKSLEKLIYGFDKSPPKNEADTRLRFIDPLFILLGWDVRNEASEIESYRDVLVEEQTNKKHAGRPDYTFKIKKAKKFFVEAKKPSVDIHGDSSPAIQVRNYGYWARLPVSILTDFEEFAVYDTRHKPKSKDNSGKYRLEYFKYTDYLKEWESITSIFSKSAVEQNSIETYIGKEKKATSRIDNDFLAEIEDWRKSLASNIALRNKDASGKWDLNLIDLNLAVQTIIDRIIFLKFAESRGMEPSEQFLHLERTEEIYQSLDSLFLKADQKYNSGLFMRGKGRQFISELHIDDSPFKKIFKFLSDTSYGFQVLPIEILGSIYERFLGNSIYFTKEKRAKIEQKPETRKAGGVYYTPEYIVSYIVENTLGELLKKKSPKEAEKIRVLDPACGSGSFVVNSYEYLLNWHLKYYVQDKNIKTSLKERRVYKLKASEKEKVKKEQEKYSDTYRLSIAEKQRILLNNIYGVDVDRQAVEVTKLSLLLKLMESEDVESEEELFKHSDVKHGTTQMLPDLSDNIKSGNSLIGSDFYHGALFPIEDKLKINAFDWGGKDGFSEIMKAGGFDVVIGNPPYVQLQKFKGEIMQKAMEEAKFLSHNSMGDIYCLFYEKGINLLKNNAILGFITSNKWMRAGYGVNLRRYFIQNTNPLQLLDFIGNKIFTDATVDCNILILEKGPNKAKCMGYNFTEEISSSEDIGTIFRKKKIPLPNLSENNWIIRDLASQKLKKKMEQLGTPLKDWDIKINYGIKTGYNDAFIIDQAKRDELITADPKSAEIIKPMLRGRDIKAYHHQWAELYMITTFPALKIKIDNYPIIKKHLLGYGKDRLKQSGKTLQDGTKSRKATGNQWFESQDQIAYYKEFEKEKIIYREISQNLNATYLTSSTLVNNKLYLITGSHLNYLLAFLNSKIVNNILLKTANLTGGKGVGYLQYLTIPKLDLSNSTQKAQHDRMVELVNQMLDTQKQLHETQSPSEKALYQKEVDRLDEQIDALVYKLYELTPAEIRIVEETR